MTKDEIVQKLTAPEIVGLTIWAESRREPLLGRLAVACVIRNRFKSGKYKSWSEVCLKKWQFSCWMPEGGASNHAALLKEAQKLAMGILPNSQALKNCLWLAHGVMTDSVEDVSYGSTHYYAPAAMVPKNRVPDWAQGQTPRVEIGHHRFYNVA